MFDAFTYGNAEPGEFLKIEWRDDNQELVTEIVQLATLWPHSITVIREGEMLTEIFRDGDKWKDVFMDEVKIERYIDSDPTT